MPSCGPGLGPKKSPRSEERGPCLTFFLFSALRSLRIALTLTLDYSSLRVKFGFFQNAILTFFSNRFLCLFQTPLFSLRFCSTDGFGFSSIFVFFFFH